MSHEALKTALESELKQLTSELSTIATQQPSTGDWVATALGEDIGNADENIEADAVEEWNERRAVVAELETRYRNINRALEKIKAGTYGICEISGDPIEPERLEANPAARTNKANIERESELPL